MPEDTPFCIYSDSLAGTSNSIVISFGARTKITEVFSALFYSYNKQIKYKPTAFLKNMFVMK